MIYAACGPDKRRAWLWVAVTATCIVFRVAKGRGVGVAKELREQVEVEFTPGDWPKDAKPLR